MHPYYHQHYGSAARPPSYMPQGSGRAADDSKKDDREGSPWRSGIRASPGEEV